MLKPRVKSGQRKTSDMIPDFWKLLLIFWNKDRIEKWKSTIFPDSQNPDIGVERCFNLIFLEPTAHDMWNRGLFALKPLKLSRDQKKLAIQFFWQVPGNYDIRSRIDLLTEPISSEGLDIIANGHWLTRLEDNNSDPRRHPIRFGETFTFTTKDPKNLPLPSLELLEMQWILQRLVGMCGAAGWPSLDWDDDDTDDNDDSWLIPDYTDCNVHSSLKRVRKRVGADEASGITPETSTAIPGASVIEYH
jgi:hypothetical protein